MTIPASSIVKVNPSVIGGGGNGLDLNGLILTMDHAAPIGATKAFTSARAVGLFFGETSIEKQMADVYFAGYKNCTKTPKLLLFSRYVGAVGGGANAYLRGGAVSGMTINQLRNLEADVMAIGVDGASYTSALIDLSDATSFSAAAIIINTAFGGIPVVSYDSQRGAFLLSSPTLGVASTITFATGPLAESLKLTAATGGILSQGIGATPPGSAMDAIVDVMQNWAAFALSFTPTNAVNFGFAAWVNTQNKRWLYAAVDDNIFDDGYTQTFVQELVAANISGVAVVYLDKLHAAFVLGATASINFARANGRITHAFKVQDGITPSVTSKSLADELTAAGLNFVGAYAAANDGFTFFSPGSIVGEYRFIDEYINQIWLNNALQLALMTLLTSMPSIPYNAQGYSLIDAACMDPINQALSFGAIRGGIPLSELQKVQVNNAAGTEIDKVLSTRGWYLQILPATAQVRAARGTPQISLWYTDGGSVQTIEMASIVVQ